MIYVFFFLVFVLFLFVFYFFFKFFNNFKIGIIVMFFCCVFTLSFYYFFGNYKFLISYYKSNVSNELNNKDLIRKIILNFNKQIILVNKIYDISNNYVLMWHLGKLYEAQGHYSKAFEFVNRAYVINNSTDIDLMVNYVLLKTRLLEGLLDDDCVTIVNKILLFNYNQYDIFNLLAINFYKRGEYFLALDYWDSVLVNFDAINDKFLFLVVEKIKSVEISNW